MEGSLAGRPARDDTAAMKATGTAARAAHYPGSAVARPCRVQPRYAIRAGLLLSACAAAAGCGGGERTRPTPVQAGGAWNDVRPADAAGANAVLMRAISLVGTPYRYGGDTPDGGFDCSGLVNYVYRDMLDLRLPRTSRALAEYQGPRIGTDRLAPADLVFFGTPQAVTHVGIYVGEGRFVHAPSTGGTVRLDRLDGPYWRDHYTGARRVLH